MNTRSLMRGVAAATLAAAAAAAAAAPAQPDGLRYRAQSIDALTGLRGTQSVSMNARGDLVGIDEGGQGFLFSRGRRMDLGPFAQPLGLNDHGDVVGGFKTGADEPYRPFLYRHGHFTDLSPLLGGSNSSTSATRINNAGQILGYACCERGFVIDQGQARYLNPPGFDFAVPAGLNDQGVIVGTTGTLDDRGVPTRSVGFQWQQGSFSLLPPPFAGPGLQYGGLAINNTGQALVHFEGVAPFPRTTTLLYEQGRYSEIGITFGFALNNRGWITGQQGDGGDPRADIHAALRRDGQVYDLNDLLDPAAARLWDLTTGLAINDRGQIVASASRSDGGRAGLVLLTPVPEPGSFALMLAGLGLIGAGTRRRRRG